MERPVTEEKHAQARDKKGRESEWGKDQQQRRPTHSLKMRGGGEVSGARTGNKGKACTF
jgi:hypothetical protein